MSKSNINGFEIDIDKMKSSTCGTIGIAEKAGKKYFCKRFNNPVMPVKNGALGELAYERNLKLFEKFEKRKRRLNKQLRSISGIGGNIVAPIEESIYQEHWTEFSEFIDEAIIEDYSSVIRHLSEEEKRNVLIIAIGALHTIHGQKIVHGDLKLTNIMLVKDDDGKYSSKIIDFDGAFFEDDVPTDSITGTVDYYSPELAVYSSIEDDEVREEYSHNITTKSDIFTMGLILHEYLAGHKPNSDGLSSKLQKMKDSGKFIYPWQVLLYMDDPRKPHQLIVDPSITNPSYVALISDMLSLDPDDRPSCAEVAVRLKTGTLPIDLKAWEDHPIVFEESAVRDKYYGLRKKKKDDCLLYEVIEKDGRKTLLNKDEVLKQHLAHPSEHYEPPREEDQIEWKMDQIKRMFYSIEPEKPGDNYKLVDRNGNARTLTVSQLVMMNFAKRKIDSVEKKVDEELVATPGLHDSDKETHMLNQEQLDEKKIVFRGHIVLSGVVLYQFSFPDGEIRSLRLDVCKMIKLIIPKK